MKKRSAEVDERRKSEKLNKTLRKATIFKKAKELSTLCGVDVALIVYDSAEQTPQTWSSRPDVINNYLSNQPQIALPRIQQSSDLRDREFINNLGFEELNGFASLLAGKIENLNKRINALRETDVGQLQELNVDDFEFTFDDLDGFDFNDLGFGKSSSDDQFLREPMSVVGNVDFTFESFSLDDLEFGSTTDQVNAESPSRLPLVYDSLGNLEYVDDDFDWVNQALMTC